MRAVENTRVYGARVPVNDMIYDLTLYDADAVNHSVVHTSPTSPTAQ